MTTVFVHGVPDTSAVWRHLANELPGTPTVALSLPGFGCAMPDGFSGSKEDYVDWLVAALEGIPGPRDVVAHDWGSILLLRVLAVRPDLIRSWVGGGAPSTPGYAWHSTARLWQTPGAGEKAMERLTPDMAITLLGRAGLDQASAAETAERIDPRMKSAILSLYRSGRDVFSEWGWAADRVQNVPGLVLWGARDAYAEPVHAHRLSEATGASVRILDCGHWWQIERPREVAAEILAFRRALNG